MLLERTIISMISRNKAGIAICKSFPMFIPEVIPTKYIIKTERSINNEIEIKKVAQERLSVFLVIKGVCILIHR